MNKDELLKFCEEVGACFLINSVCKNGERQSNDCRSSPEKSEIICLSSERENQLIVAVKQKPELSEELRDHFKDLNPAWHMNKTHWNDIRVGVDVSDELLQQMIFQSYDLIKPKK